jgi:putative ABC transport system ATP-binding protein
VGIRLESVGKQYATPAGPVKAVGGIELEVEPGTSLAVMGPSGCGKSTLLGLIAGLEVPSEGRVTVGDQEISSLGAEERARVRRGDLGLVFQADNLLPFLTAVENVSLQLVLSRARDDPGECRALLADLGLSGEDDKLPDQLSGGQRQRVAVARALVHRPRLVLADEPTGALDSGNSAVVIDALLAAQRESGATLVVVTHDADVARRLDNTIRMRDGRLDHRHSDTQG